MPVRTGVTWVLAAAISLFVGAPSFGATTVILVRHAEKQTTPGDADPSLNDAGRVRAMELARTLAEADLDAIVVSQFRRTQETVAPAAARHRIEPDEHDARDVRGTATTILQRHADSTVLLCGHSNTVPDLIRALGVETDLTLTEDEYDDLFIVTIEDDGTARLLRLHYGAPSP